MITLILLLLYLHRTVLFLCTVLCFALRLFLYACMHVRFLYVYTHPALVKYLLVARCRMQPRRDSVYLLYTRSLVFIDLPCSSTVMYLVRLSSYRTGVMLRSTLTLLFLFGCCGFTSAFIMPCSGLFTDCPCTLFILYVGTHVLLVAILFFGWCLCTWLVSLYLVQNVC